MIGGLATPRLGGIDLPPRTLSVLNHSARIRQSPSKWTGPFA